MTCRQNYLARTHPPPRFAASLAVVACRGQARYLHPVIRRIDSAALLVRSVAYGEAQGLDPEWLASYPLDDQTKFTLFRDCSRCHTMQRASLSTYNAGQLTWVMKRMVSSAGRPASIA